MEVQRKRLIQIKIVERERRNKIMTLTRDFKEIVNARIQSDPTFAAPLLDEAISLFLNGEPETARLILRDLISSTVGFEGLAIETSQNSSQFQVFLS
jgi:hypothetical protein